MVLLSGRSSSLHLIKKVNKKIQRFEDRQHTERKREREKVSDDVQKMKWKEGSEEKGKGINQDTSKMKGNGKKEKRNRINKENKRKS